MPFHHSQHPLSGDDDDSPRVTWHPQRVWKAWHGPAAACLALSSAALPSSASLMLHVRARRGSFLYTWTDMLSSYTATPPQSDSGRPRRWESGYWASMDIAHDRAGYYLCWGCLNWVPAIYTSPALALVTPAQPLGTPLAAAILLAGAASVLINYDSDRQRQVWPQWATTSSGLVWAWVVEILLACRSDALQGGRGGAWK